MSLFGKKKPADKNRNETGEYKRDDNGLFTKGTKGGPGRPKLGNTLAEMVRNALNEALEGDYTKRDELIDIAFAKAKKGDYKYFDWLFSRGYGKVPDVINLNKKQELDMSKYTDEELVALKTLLKKQDTDGDTGE